MRQKTPTTERQVQSVPMESDEILFPLAASPGQMPSDAEAYRAELLDLGFSDETIEQLLTDRQKCALCE